MLSAWRVSKRSAPGDDIRPQIMAGRKALSAFHLVRDVRDTKPFQCERERAWQRGWWRLTCALALGQTRACHMSMSSVSPQGRLNSTLASIPLKTVLTLPGFAAGRT